MLKKNACFRRLLSLEKYQPQKKANTGKVQALGKNQLTEEASQQKMQNNKTTKGYEKNMVRETVVGDSHLLTVDSGSWILLGEEAYRKFKDDNIISDRILYDLLEKKHIILTAGNRESYVAELRRRHARLGNGPSLHIVAITGRCNNICVYCHANATPTSSISDTCTDAEGNTEKKKSINSQEMTKDMSKETAEKVVDFIFQSPNKNIAIEFQGGEPLLNFPAIIHIVEYAKEKNRRLDIGVRKSLKFDLVSNLAAMDEKKLEFIMQNKIGLCTSLDGPAHVHNMNRKTVSSQKASAKSCNGFGKIPDALDNQVGTHENTVRWISKIRKEHDHPIDALMVTTRHSLGYPEEIVDQYISLGLSNIQLRPLSCLGYAKKNMDDIGYAAEEYISFWKKAMDHIFEINTRQLRDAARSKGSRNNDLKLFYDRFARYLAMKFFSVRGLNFVDLDSPCGAVIGTLAYDHKGDIFTCDEGRQFEEFMLGNVFEPYRKVMASREAASIIGLSVNDCLLCDACAWKPFCGICPVCNYSETGNVLPILPQNSRCQILKAQFSYMMEKMQDKGSVVVLRQWLRQA